MSSGQVHVYGNYTLPAVLHVINACGYCWRATPHAVHVPVRLSLNVRFRSLRALLSSHCRRYSGSSSSVRRSMYVICRGKERASRRMSQPVCILVNGR